MKTTPAQSTPAAVGQLGIGSPRVPVIEQREGGHMPWFSRYVARKSDCIMVGCVHEYGHDGAHEYATCAASVLP